LAILLQNTDEKSEVADLLEAKNTIMSFHVTGAGKIDVLYLLPVKKEISIAALQSTLLGKNSDLGENKRRTFAGVDIYELNFPARKCKFTFAVSGSILIGSFTSFLVEDAIRQQKTGKLFGGNTQFEKQYDESLGKHGFSVCINYAKLKALLSTTLEQEFEYKLNELEYWAGWSVQSFSISKSEFTAAGVFEKQDTAMLISSFAEGTARKIEATGVLPEKTIAFQSYAFNNSAAWLAWFGARIKKNDIALKLEKRIAQQEEKLNIPVRSNFSSLLSSEVTVALYGAVSVNVENNLLVFIKTKNVADAKKTLQKLSAATDGTKKISVEDYKSFQIGFIPVDGLIPCMLGNTFSLMRKNYYTIYKDFIVLANKPSLLRTYLNDMEDAKVFNATTFYTENKVQFEKPCNFFMYAQPGLALPLWIAISNQQNKRLINQYSDLIGSINTFIYTATAITNTEVQCNTTINFGLVKQKKPAEQQWVYFADTTVHTGPFSFTNNAKLFILFQDDSNNVCCLTDGGNLKWKLPLESPIVGSIKQSPPSETGKLQFIFCTAEKIFLINEDGFVSAKYPFKLPAATTQGIFASPASPYYFLPASNKQLFVFDYAGRPAHGWEMRTTDDIIPNGITFNHDGTKLFFTDASSMIYLYAINGKLLFKKKSESTDASLLFAGSDTIPLLTSIDSTGSILLYRFDNTLAKRKSSITNARQLLIANVTTDDKNEYIVVKNNELIIADENANPIATVRTNATILPGWQLMQTPNESFIALPLSDNQLLVLDSKGSIVTGFPVEATGFSWTVLEDCIQVIIKDKKDRISAIKLTR
jgi:hypothetical protein